MQTEIEPADDVKEFAQITIPTAQLSLYEKDGWEFVEHVTCTVRKRLIQPESPP